MALHTLPGYAGSDVGIRRAEPGALCQAGAMSDLANARHLFVLRHAKSSWPDVADRERPLAERGRHDAPAAGRWLHDAAGRPGYPRIDHVVCSPARRTRETWELVSAQLDSPPEAVYDERVYGATTTTLLTVVRGTPDNVRSLLLIGHNPGVHDLSLALADETSDSAALATLRQKYPTSSIAHFVVGTEWTKVSAGGLALADFAIPRGDGTQNGD